MATTGATNYQVNYVVTADASGASTALDGLGKQITKVNDAIQKLSGIKKDNAAGLHQAVNAVNRLLGSKVISNPNLATNLTALGDGLNSIVGAFAKTNSEKKIKNLETFVKSMQTLSHMKVTTTLNKENAENMARALGRMVPVIDSLGKIGNIEAVKANARGITSAFNSLSKLKVNTAQVSAARGVFDVMARMNAIGSLTNAGKGMRTLSATMNGIANAAIKMSDSQMYNKLTAIKEMFKELNGLSKTGGFSVEIDVSGAESNLNILLKKIAEVKAAMGSIGAKALSKGGGPIGFSTGGNSQNDPKNSSSYGPVMRGNTLSPYGGTSNGNGTYASTGNIRYFGNGFTVVNSSSTPTKPVRSSYEIGFTGEEKFREDLREWTKKYGAISDEAIANLRNKIFSGIKNENGRHANIMKAYNMLSHFGGRVDMSGFDNNASAIQKMLLKDESAYTSLLNAGKNGPSYKGNVAGSALLMESMEIINSHRMFNQQLANNYRMAVSEAQGGAGVIGSGNYNPFNPIASNTAKQYKVPRRQVGWRHRGWTQQQYADEAQRINTLRQMYQSDRYAEKYFKRESTRVANKRVSNSRNALAQRRAELSNKVLGTSMLDSGGLGITSMLKGMGVMYGISGIGSLFSKSFKDYTDYENLMTTTKNILGSHDTGENFTERFVNMSHTIRNVGVKTKFTAPEVADAAKFLAMAGLSLEDINNAITPITNVALVGDTGLGETADMLTNIMTGYGIRSNQMDKVSDIMTNTFTMANVTLPELAESFKYAANLLALRGVSFQESSAALGVLGNAGIKASQAGTTMRAILLNLYKPTLPQARQWAKVRDANGNQMVTLTSDGKIAQNYITEDATGRKRSLFEIFDILSRYKDQINPQAMFNRNASQGATALMQNITRWQEIMSNNYLSEGLSNKLSEAKQNTLQGLWAKMASTFTEGAIQAFEGSDSALRDQLKGFTELLGSEQGKNDIRDIIKTVFDLIGAVKTFSGVILEIYHRFGGFIKLFLEFQIYAKAVLLPLRAFKGLLNMGASAAVMVKTIGGLAVGMRGLTSALTTLIPKFGTFIGMTNASSGMGMMSGYVGANSYKNIGIGKWLFASARNKQMVLPDAPFSQRFMGLYGGRLDKYSSWDEFQRKDPQGYGVTRMALGGYGISEREMGKYYSYKKQRGDAVVARALRMYRGRALGNMIGGLGSIGLGMGGAYLGSYIGEPGSATSMMGSMGLGMLGTVAGGPLLAKLGTGFSIGSTAIPGLGAIPGVGWAILAASLIGVAAYKYKKHQDELTENMNNLNKFFEERRDAMNYENDPYYKYIMTREGDLQEVLDKSIEKLKKEHGLLFPDESVRHLRWDEVDPEGFSKINEVGKATFDIATGSYNDKYYQKPTDIARDPWHGILQNYEDNVFSSDNFTVINKLAGGKLMRYDVKNYEQMLLNRYTFERGFDTNGLFKEEYAQLIKDALATETEDDLMKVIYDFRGKIITSYKDALEFYKKKGWINKIGNLSKEEIKESGKYNIMALMGLYEMTTTLEKNGRFTNPIFSKYSDVLKSNWDEGNTLDLLSLLDNDAKLGATVWNNKSLWGQYFGIGEDGIVNDENKLKLLKITYGGLNRARSQWFPMRSQYRFSFIDNSDAAKYLDTEYVPNKDDQRNPVLSFGEDKLPYKLTGENGQSFVYVGENAQLLKKYKLLESYPVNGFFSLRNQINAGADFRGINKSALATPDGSLNYDFGNDFLFGGEDGSPVHEGGAGKSTEVNIDVDVNVDATDSDHKITAIVDMVQDAISVKLRDALMASDVNFS